MLAKLVHEGFNGPIYCTEATADLLRVLLWDAAGLYQRDLERNNVRRERAGKDLILAEYDNEDVEAALHQCSTSSYAQGVKLSEQASLCFHDADS